MTTRYGPRFEAALVFAASNHFGQIRKGNGAPYITHPLAVASIVGDFGGDEDQAIAALLHDLLEDCGVTATELADRFGDRVASIVVRASDTTEKPKPPWRPRKEAHLAELAVAPHDAKLVIAADKLHNALTILRDIERPSVGEALWSRFRAGKRDVLWYYRTAHAALAQGWEHELCHALGRVVDLLHEVGAEPDADVGGEQPASSGPG